MHSHCGKRIGCKTPFRNRINIELVPIHSSGTPTLFSHCMKWASWVFYQRTRSGLAPKRSRPLCSQYERCTDQLPTGIVEGFVPERGPAGDVFVFKQKHWKNLRNVPSQPVVYADKHSGFLHTEMIMLCPFAGIFKPASIKSKPIIGMVPYLRKLDSNGFLQTLQFIPLSTG